MQFNANSGHHASLAQMLRPRRAVAPYRLDWRETIITDMLALTSRESLTLDSKICLHSIVFKTSTSVSAVALSQVAFSHHFGVHSTNQKELSRSWVSKHFQLLSVNASFVRTGTRTCERSVPATFLPSVVSCVARLYRQRETTSVKRRIAPSFILSQKS